MPRRRAKTRVERLADALGKAMEARAELSQIDLRTTGGELRETVKAARAEMDTLIESLGDALRLDVPAPTGQTTRPKLAEG